MKIIAFVALILLNVNDLMAAHKPVQSLKPGLSRVTFVSEGDTLMGNLFLPTGYRAGQKYPIVFVMGSWTTVKEQMANLYAQRLADHGLIAFTFDFRHWGECGGQPRLYKNPTHKIQDIHNAVTYLLTQPMVQPQSLAGVVYSAMVRPRIISPIRPTHPCRAATSGP